jgi:hypothetical protein
MQMVIQLTPGRLRIFLLLAVLNMLQIIIIIIIIIKMSLLILPSAAKVSRAIHSYKVSQTIQVCWIRWYSIVYY